jgi:prepilin-type N-terminal cleavage/methylation domain-containing protein
MKFLQGFTMIEVALSLSILAIMFAMSMPMYRIFMIRNDLDIATMNLVQNLRRAQTLSQVLIGDRMFVAFDMLSNESAATGKPERTVQGMWFRLVRQ